MSGPTLRKTRLLRAAFAVLAGFVGAAQAQTVAQNPLFLTNAVKPNILLAIDDSGSMDSEVLFPTNDGAAWWHTSDQGFSGRDQDNAERPGALNFNAQGAASSTWKKYVYLFPNGVGKDVGLRVYQDATHDHYAIAPLPQFAWARAPAFNAAYFDPAAEYPPWRRDDGGRFADAPPAAAPTDPVLGNTTIDLTATVARDDKNTTFRMYAGMVIPAGVRHRILGVDASFVTRSQAVVIDQQRDVAIAYFPATFYLPEGTALPAGYGYTGPTLAGTAPDGSTPLVGYEIRPENFASTGQYQEALQRFANWFTYYRKRHLATRAGIGLSFGDISSVRLGSFFINNRTPLAMRDLGLASDRAAVYASIYGKVGNGGTPNREAVNHCGLQLQRTDADAPVQVPCQKNFAILFTDGYSNASSVSGIGNEDAAPGPYSGVDPYRDGVSGTMADIAMKYYANPLRTGAGFPPGRVTLPPGCASTNPPPALDCNPDLHMVFYAVTLGVRGILFDPDTPVDPYLDPPAWPTTFPNRHPSAVDDLWHASINGRGALLNARTPREVASTLTAVLRDISARSSSAASVATNTTRLSTDSAIYQARFSSADWSGQLLALPIQPDGSIGAPLWDAAEQLPSAAARSLFTIDPTASAGSRGRGFLWNALTAEQQAALNRDAFGAVDNLGTQRLDYLRGSTADEAPAGAGFRARATRLGDIVNSDPVFVGRQDFGYAGLPGVEGSSYDSFRDSAAYQNRPEMIYVGANDGKLHGFDAETGRERFAFVPNRVFPALSALTDRDYANRHRYFVDGASRAVDAYLNGSWRSILVGSLGAGGRAVFALDVTRPENFSASQVLWEFSDLDDADLGFQLPQPSIARLRNGSWVAIIANGYGSGSQRAQLFVLDLQTGAVLAKLDTRAGDASFPNGLSSPFPADIDGDRIADVVYAGDLQGNLWKFDLTADNPNQWRVAFGSASNPAPLFQACETNTCSNANRQPITARPEVGLNPDGGVVVYFGTGRYFADGDNDAAIGRQSFYGIYDRDVVGQSPSPGPHPGRGALLEQSVIGVAQVGDEDVRLTTDFKPDPTQPGWVLDLPLQGERQVSTPILRGGRIIFTTLIPETDVCSFGGDSWLMELDALTGSRLEFTPFDLNDDRRFDSDDFAEILIDGELTPIPVSGRRSREGIIKSPGIIQAGEIEFKYASGTTGGIDTTVERGSDASGRQSWRQLP
jgi:type IV pilus assembly protein PilY1